MMRHHSVRIAKLEQQRGLTACGADRVSVIVLRAAMPDDLHEASVTGLCGREDEFVARLPDEPVAALHARAVPMLRDTATSRTTILAYAYAGLGRGDCHA